MPPSNSMKMISYICNPIIVSGILLLFITLGSSSVNAIAGMITGYFFIVAGIVGYLIILLMNNASDFSLITALSIFIGMIACFLTMIMLYFSRISEGHVPAAYNSAKNIFLSLILLSNLIIYFGTRDATFYTSLTIPQKYILGLYFFMLFGFLTLYKLYIILRYFITDG